MLPGIRFLFAALVLWISILIFGLGAAALFRAAHEEVASIPVRRGPPERVFAQLNESSPTLAMVRVDTPPAESPATTATAVAAVPPVADAPAPMEAAEPKAVNTDDAPPAEAEKADTPAAGAPAAEPAPALADTAAPVEETKPAAVADASPATEAAPVTSETPPSGAAPEESSATSKIATLGGPPVAIEETAAEKATEAKQDPDAVKKRALAQRARERRRLAERARAAQQAAVQQQLQQQFAYPFPMLTAATRPVR